MPPELSGGKDRWQTHIFGLLTISLIALGTPGCDTRHGRSHTRDIPETSTVQVWTDAEGVHLRSATSEFLMDSSGYVKASLRQNGTLLSLDEASGHSGQKITVNGRIIEDFGLDLGQVEIKDANGKLGKLGKHVEIRARSASTSLLETINLEIYDDFPSMALLSASFRNPTNQDIQLEQVSLQSHQLNASLEDPRVAPNNMWAFFGSSLKWGKDEILPIPAKFSQDNPFSVPINVDGDAGGAGGGIPVIAFWTRQIGEAIGHIETLPFVVSIPVETTSDLRVSTAVKFPAGVNIKPGETYSVPRTFVAVYSGDYYRPLSQWANVLDREGLRQIASNTEDYAVSWCGWGYRSDVTPKQMLDTIPKIKELGIHWATLDDGWFDNYGDLRPRTDTFPAHSLEQLVKDFHAQEIKVQLWWLPLAAEDGAFSYNGHRMISDVVKDHPDWLILDQQGKPARMARNLVTLCPAFPEVRDYYKRLTEHFIRDWDFDGHKLDNIFATPRCYNPKHHHKSPDDSVNAMGDVYKLIFETTRALKPDSVTQLCSCGTPPSLSWFRYMDQAVTGDPVGSTQVRRRIKMYKALLGPHAAVYGDHVELTRIIDPNTTKAQQLGRDFASTVGTGGVPGTKFTWPDYGPKFSHIYLTPEKEVLWKKWISLYNEKMLSQGEFRDLYTLGYDFPEAYAIEKDRHMYYAFFNEKNPAWDGEVELRGLQTQSYKVFDYVNLKDYGTVTGPTAKLRVSFRDHLLLEATPAKPGQE